MTTYSELEAQAAELLKQAEKLRKEEIKSVIAEIRARMAEYGIVVDDLRTAFKAGTKGKAVKPKYRNPETGATWTGRGKPPNWLKGAEALGVSREKFRIS